MLCNGFINNIQSLFPHCQYHPWLWSLESVYTNSMLMLIIFIIICWSLLLACVFQAWITVRFWSKWSEGTGCRVPRIVPSHCTSWCCSAGKEMLKSGPPSSTCKPSWRTILLPLSLNTSLGTTSKHRLNQCWKQKSGALPARNCRGV